MVCGCIQLISYSSRIRRVYRQADYPFFTTLNRILDGKLPPTALLEYQNPDFHAPEPDASASNNGASANAADAPLPVPA